MGRIIGMAGKGGTGKTTVAALIVRILKERKLGSVLAIDADPNSNLGESLGLNIEDDIGSILDEIAAHPEKIPAGMPKDRYIEFRLQGAIAEADGFDLLTMGRPEGPGCYCYVNNTLRNMIGRLIDNYDYIVIDNEAGLEHLSRRTTGRIEAMVVVSGPTQAGLRSADRISALVDELALKVKHRFLIMNCASQDSVIIDKIKESKLDYLGSVAKDRAIEELSQRGGSLMELDGDSLSLSTLSRIGEKIWQQG